jgi:hypothetical protein
VKRPPPTLCSVVTASPVSGQNTAPSASIQPIRVPEVALHTQQPYGRAQTCRTDLWGTPGHAQGRETAPPTSCSVVTASPVSIRNTAPSASIHAIQVPEDALHTQQPCGRAQTCRTDLSGTPGHVQGRETPPTHIKIRGHHITCFRSEHRPIDLDSRHSSPTSRPTYLISIVQTYTCVVETISSRLGYDPHPHHSQFSEVTRGGTKSDGGL